MSAGNTHWGAPVGCEQLIHRLIMARPHFELRTHATPARVHEIHTSRAEIWGSAEALIILFYGILYDPKLGIARK